MAENTITWTVSIEQANHILTVLGREPHDKVAQLILSLRMQWARQQQQQQRASAKPDKEDGVDFEEAMGA